jgi:ketol-acid reductoisomerase
MMIDWDNDDVNLLTWSMLKLIKKTVATTATISEQNFDNGVLMIAMVKAGVELAFETMTQTGIIEESAYYESL